MWARIRSLVAEGTTVLLTTQYLDEADQLADRVAVIAGGRVRLTTRRIRIGPLVASPNFRHPVPFAKELMTLDDLSGGRLTVGIGAGGTGWDATVLGQAPWPGTERAARFAEFVEMTDLLLRQPATSFTGRFWTADGARNVPGCIQRPRVPFAIAATGPRGMHLAATHGQMWVTTGDPVRPGHLKARDGAREVGRLIGRLDEACDAVGRDRASLARMVLTGPQLEPGLGSAEEFRDTVGRYTDAGVTDLVIHWPRPDEPYAGDPATFEAVFAAR